MSLFNILLYYIIWKITGVATLFQKSGDPQLAPVYCEGQALVILSLRGPWMQDMCLVQTLVSPRLERMKRRGK